MNRSESYPSSKLYYGVFLEDPKVIADMIERPKRPYTIIDRCRKTTQSLKTWFSEFVQNRRNASICDNMDNGDDDNINLNDNNVNINPGINVNLDNYVNVDNCMDNNSYANSL